MTVMLQAPYAGQNTGTLYTGAAEASLVAAGTASLFGSTASLANDLNTLGLGAPYINRGFIDPAFKGDLTKPANAAANFTNFMAALTQAVSERRTLRCSDPIAMGSLVAITPALLGGYVLPIEMRDADGVEFIWTGNDLTSDFFEITAPVRVVNMTINGNRSPSIQRSDDTALASRCLFGIHGSMVADSATQLDGVIVEYVKVYNARHAAGVAMQNLINHRIGTVDVSNNWGAAFLHGGSQRGTIDKIIGTDIGNWGPETGRAGQVASLFSEADPNKAPTGWWQCAYPVGQKNLANSQFNRNSFPLQDIAIGEIVVKGATDTSIYLRGNGPPNSNAFGTAGTALGEGVATRRISVARITALNAGKDLLKVRNYASDIQIGRVFGRRIGNRGLAVENFSSKVAVEWIDCRDFRTDIYNELMGTPGPYTGADGGRNQTLATSPYGIQLGDSDPCANVTIGGGYIEGVPLKSDNTAGFGIFITNCPNIKLRCTVKDIDAIGVQIAGCTTGDVQATILDACRAVPATDSRSYGAYTSDGTIGLSGRFEFQVSETTGTPTMGYAYRHNSPTLSADVVVRATTSQFLHPNFGGGMTVFNGTTGLTEMRGSYNFPDRLDRALTSGTTFFNFHNTSRVSNLGATGIVQHVLPATPHPDQVMEFTVKAAFALRIAANTGQTISLNGTLSSTGANNRFESATIGASMRLRYNAANTTWYAETVTGAWTAS